MVIADFFFKEEAVEMRDSQLFGNNAQTQYGTEPPCVELEKLPGCNDIFPSS